MIQMKEVFEQALTLDKPIIDKKLVEVIIRRMKSSQTFGGKDNESENDGVSRSVKNS